MSCVPNLKLPVLYLLSMHKTLGVTPFPEKEKESKSSMLRK
jgi:hypothetical protein